ncbi:MAG: radical SAM protein [Candidatus Omnitrophota bacterium]|nr:radical SAM protein [Candidatus Omnitrophota bacterium]
MTQTTANPNISHEALKAYGEFIAGLKIRRPKELVLINPQLVPEGAFDPLVARNRGYYAFPPVGLLYIAAVAKKVHPELKVRIVDLNLEVLRRAQRDDFRYDVWKDIIADVLNSCEAPHVGVTCMFGATKPIFLEVTRWLREEFPDYPILAGGVQATYDAVELLESNCCDLLFRREAEDQFLNYMLNLLGDDSVFPVGALFRFDGKTYELGRAEGDPPVDWDISEFYEMIDVKDYYLYGSLAAFSRYNGEDKPFATVLTNRGCRARCTFCTVRDFNGFGVRGRPIQSVIDEIKFLVSEKGVKQIDWLDDDLLWDPARAVELFKGLAEQVPGLEWICNNGLISAAVTDEIMEWMVKSGLRAFKIGIESGNDEMLHKIKKPTTKVKLRQGRALYRKYPEVFVSANLIVGFPNETFSQMLDTFNFANELKWDWSSFYICQPLKGTEMFSAFQALGDDRTEVESYDKTLNPGRAAARGEFGYRFKEGGEVVATGRDVFKLPPDLIPSQEQNKEIWFAFNLVANFLENFNFGPGGNPKKIVKWLESIAHAYPYDASMCAGLAKGYSLLGRVDRERFYREKFIEILRESSYWQKRTKEFPELLEMADVPAVML